MIWPRWLHHKVKAQTKPGLQSSVGLGRFDRFHVFVVMRALGQFVSPSVTPRVSLSFNGFAGKRLVLLPCFGSRFPPVGNTGNRFGRFARVTRVCHHCLTS